MFCPCYTSAYKLPSNKPIFFLYKGFSFFDFKTILLGFSFFDLGYNCNCLAQLYLVGMVQIVSLKERNSVFCSNTVVIAVMVYKPGKPFGER